MMTGEIPNTVIVDEIPVVQFTSDYALRARKNQWRWRL